MTADTLVLLHGLGRTPLAMAGLGRYLQRQGYRVINQGYPSRQQAIPGLSRQLFQTLVPRLPDAGRIHFVTHSMGGILLRHGVQQGFLDSLEPGVQGGGRWGRVLMLAPPNQGSELVDHLRHWPLVPRLMGPAFLQLGTDVDSEPHRLLQKESRGFPFELGVIAGSRSVEPWNHRWLTGDHDGKVTVASARHPAMQDFRVLPVNHTFIMNDQNVRKQIVHFLQHGAFS